MVKETIHEKAEKLGIKKENLELGLKKDKKAMEKMIDAANAFMNRKRK